MKRTMIYGALLLLGFVTGWLTHRHGMVQVPMGRARLEIPVGCKHRLWMNGVETDCADGPSIYFVQKLKQTSPD